MSLFAIEDTLVLSVYNRIRNRARLNARGAIAFVVMLLAIVCGSPALAAVVVEGKPVAADVHPGGEMIAYRPVLDALMIEHTYNRDLRTVRARRPYDNAIIELVLPEGLVRANGRPAGMLPDADREQPADGWLTPNAISILSGAVASKTADGWKFDLDERLRPDTNLQLWINGKRVTPGVAPRASGSLLLVPLRPVVDALGSRATLDGSQVSVVRLQDGAVMTWNAVSGLVAANKKPVGIVNGSALVDLNALLLPKDAVAALTGTNITLQPGSNRVEVSLDDRLAENLTPSALAIDRVRGTPTEIERLTFQLGTSGSNLLNVRAHSGLYAGTFRLEAPASGAWLGRFDNGNQQVDNPLKPTWASLDWQSLMGLSGIVGDGVASRRELDGVLVSRWRGAALAVPLGPEPSASSVRFIAGELLSNEPTGSTQGVFYPRFGGTVLGGRWYAGDGNNELGVNFKRDPVREEGNLTVASWNRQSRWLSSLIGGMSTALYSDLHLGHVDRYLGGWGGRGLVTLSGTFANGWNSNISGNYTSGAMNGPLARDQPGRLSRPADSGGIDASIGGPLDLATSVGARAFGRRNGLEDPFTSRSHGWGANLGRQWAAIDATATIDYSTASGEAKTDTVTSHTEVDRISLTLDKRWNESIWSARLEDTRSKGSIDLRQRSATITYSAAPWLFIGSKNQSLSFAPLLSASWSRAESAGSNVSSFGRNLAANFAFQSGSLLGEKWRVSLNAGWSGFHNSIRDERVNIQLADLLTGNTTKLVNEQNASSTGWYFNLRSQHRLSRNLILEWGGNKAQGGDAYGYLQLNGAFDFAPVQVKSLPRSGRGVVEGFVYLDENGNGIHDAGERGVPLAEVRLLGTPWTLRTNGAGHFTVNNLPQGAYGVTVDLASLPLGYRIAEAERLRFSILDQQVTDIKVPIVEAGQIRGRAFIDKNGNGIADDGEDGAIERTVELTGRNYKMVTRSAVFGQFVFDVLPLGIYNLRIGERQQAVEITSMQKFVVINLPVAE